MARAGASEAMESNPLDDDCLERYAHELYKCLKKDQLVKAKFTMKGLKKEERKKVVCKTFDGNAPLFLAAQHGLVHFVNFILDECGADVEQRGVYEVIEDRSRHKVTPLWCAAVANQLEVVKSLIEHSADVNASSDTQSTPVRSACYMTNIEVVRLLVHHGAEIHKPNVNGGTCLINSVQSLELCQFLVERGADVNAQDSSGNTALHYAIREGRMDTVKLLVNSNTNAYTKNDFGDDALQTASLRGFPQIVDYLVTILQPSLERQISAMELMGTNFVDEKHNVQEALQVWKKAMELRQAAGLEVAPKAQPIAAYNYKEEAQTLAELERTGCDQESMYMQALLIRERILGPDHKDTIFGLMYRGAVYADTHRYQRCVDLWKYAYHLRHEKQDPLNYECLFTLQALCKLFLEIHEEHLGGYTSEAVAFEDVMTVFDMACGQVIAAFADMQHNNAQNPPPPPYGEFYILLQLVLHLLYLLGRLPASPTQARQLRCRVHFMLRQGIKTPDGRTLLHLCHDRKTSHVADEYYASFPSLLVTELLLECGASINALDNDGNTALHYCATVMQRHMLDDREREEVEKIAALLLSKGVHPDARNRKGHIAGEGLAYWQKFHLNDNITLKCRAARVIRKEHVAFEGEVPKGLVSFIMMH